MNIVNTFAHHDDRPPHTAVPVSRPVHVTVR
ncbi:hypothetical protein STRAU_1367 [Streptomyces aurantiacus JA 4570]|uniref:Uncharacterized protein n=1 Tax=Streptomyces aurantiacus JA 4570 TaxID=1286094 RepID=S3ZQ03_9ACTN|nr:hypothetical protein STRAU_1367 [Streptomyces aurantiacus JA 4570]